MYQLQVTADDGNGGSATQLLSVTVTDVNEDPAITSASSTSVPENTLAVLTVTSSDVDGDISTYSISGGADGGLFAINGVTGDLTFLAAPNFESPGDSDTDNVYQLQVTADDGNGGSAIQSLSVTVTDVNGDPTITSASSTSVPENTLAVLTVTSSDVDGDVPTYSITGGADQDLFAIDGVTGDLTFLAAPNFEAPGDSDTDNVYQLQVTADDGNGGTDARVISVTVTDTNDVPISTADSYSVGHSDSLSVAAPGVLAGDSDEDGHTLTVSIVSGPTKGVLVLNPDGSFSYTPNAHATGIDAFTYEVDDANGGTATATVTITIHGAGGSVNPVKSGDTEPPPDDSPPPENTPPDESAEEDQMSISPSVPTARHSTNSGDAPVDRRLNTTVVTSTPLDLTTPSTRTIVTNEPIRRAERIVQNVSTDTVVGPVQQWVASFNTVQLWDGLANMKEDIQSNSHSPYFVAGSAAGVTSVLSVGYVLWTIRSGWLVTSLLAQLPAWQLIDPLVVLDYLDEESGEAGRNRGDDDDDSLESMLEENETDQQPETQWEQTNDFGARHNEPDTATST